MDTREKILAARDDWNRYVARGLPGIYELRRFSSFLEKTKRYEDIEDEVVVKEVIFTIPVDYLARGIRGRDGIRRDIEYTALTLPFQTHAQEDTGMERHLLVKMYGITPYDRSPQGYEVYVKDYPVYYDRAMERKVISRKSDIDHWNNPAVSVVYEGENDEGDIVRVGRMYPIGFVGVEIDFPTIKGYASPDVEKRMKVLRKHI